jgi:PiT family inorganic phosphate transporter
LTPLSSYLEMFMGLALCVILGANNLSTCLGTSVGAGALRYSRALVLASVGLVAGVFLEGDKLTHAITSGVVLSTDPALILAVALSTFGIMAFLTFRKLPISLSQVAIGAAIGAALALGIPVNWKFTLLVASSWLLTPLVGLMLAVLLTLCTRRLGKRIRRILTLNAFYGYLTIFSGIYASYTLGANTVGLIVGMMKSLGFGIVTSISFGIATILGMIVFSKGTTRSVSENIVGLSPSASFAAQMGGALTVHGFTEVGIPVSVSQAVVGGIFGASIPRNIVVRNDRLAKEIVVGWTVAPLLGGVLAVLLVNFF